MLSEGSDPANPSKQTFELNFKKGTYTGVKLIRIGWGWTPVKAISHKIPTHSFHDI